MQIRLLILALLSLPALCRAQDLYDDTRVREMRVVFAQPNWRDLLTQNVKAELDIPATLTIDGVTLDSVGVRYKGNSSFNIPGDKKPFNITTDTYRSGQQYLGYTTFNLNNFFKDPTCVRESIAYGLATLYLPSVKTAYVTLFINGKYWGLYLHVQQPNRDFLRAWFGNDSGNCFKGDPRGDLTWQGPDTAKYRANYELKTNEARNDYSDLVGFIEALNTLPPQRIAAELPARLNVDRALWYIAFCNVLCNLDSYIGSGHNYYAYHNPTDDRFSIIPWDLNEVLGTFSQQLSLGERERLSFAYGNTSPARPLVAKLLAVPEFRARYIAHYRTILSETFTRAYWEPRIQRYQDLIRDDVAADTNKLYTMKAFADNVAANVQVAGPIGGTVPGILSFIDNRRASLLSMPDLTAVQASIAMPAHSPQLPAHGDAVTVRAAVSGAANVLLYWSVNGRAFSRAPMAPAGSAFEAAIPGYAQGTTVRYYIEALTAAGVAVYHPARAEHEFHSYIVRPRTGVSSVVINEVLGLNHATLPDPQGDYDDWIELHNTADSAVDLSGCFLSASLSNPRKWRIPDGTVLASHGYLLVWADDDTTDTPGLHANFKINKDGEAVYFFDTDARGNALLDSSSSTTYEQDVAWARSPNATGPFIARIPTPNGNNDTPDAADAAPSSDGFTVTAFPNPARGNTLFVRTLRGGGRPAIVRLSDVLGRVVATKEIDGDAMTALDIAPLPSGHYLLRVESADAVHAGTRIRIVR
jgi:spore coat protein CotH